MVTGAIWDQNNRFGDQSDTKAISVWCWLHAAISCRCDQVMRRSFDEGQDPTMRYGQSTQISHIAFKELSQDSSTDCTCAWGQGSSCRIFTPETQLPMLLLAALQWTPPVCHQCNLCMLFMLQNSTHVDLIEAGQVEAQVMPYLVVTPVPLGLQSIP